jgi:hypothetical protein
MELFDTVTCTYVSPIFYRLTLPSPVTPVEVKSRETSESVYGKVATLYYTMVSTHKQAWARTPEIFSPTLYFRHILCIL